LPAFIGFVTGVALTIALAYEYDSSSGRIVNGLPASAANGGPPLVNWDVFRYDRDYVGSVIKSKVDDVKRKL
jgi:hypothetical protein